MRRLACISIACVIAACGDDGGMGPADAGMLGDGSVDAGGREGEDAGPAMRVLHVRTSGDGEGAVTGADGAIACGDGMTSCNVAFPEGAEVTLEASPVGPSVFAGWAGEGLDCTDGTSCTFTLDGDLTIIASFDLDDLSLMVTTDGGGTGTVTSDPAGVDCPDTCAASFTAFTEVTLTATPDGSSDFTGWSGACEGTDGDSCTVTLGEALSVGATFELREVTLEVELTGDGEGSVSSTPVGIDCGSTCTMTATWGTEVILTAAAVADTSTLSDFTGCTASGDTCTFELTGDTAVQVGFALHRHDLDVTVDGTGTGVVTSTGGGIDCGSDCAETYAHGTTVTLTASPESATSELAGWSGACAGETSTECTVDITDATSVTATFDLLSRNLNVSTSGAGSGTVTSAPAGIDCGSDCSEPFVHGTMVTLTAIPDAASSTFGAWGGACSGVTTTTCEVDMTAVRTVTVRFDLASRDLAVSVTGSGSGQVSSSPGGISCGADCDESYTHGTSVTLTASPASGSSFTEWGGACAGEGSIFCTITMSSAKTVSATFD